MQREFLGKIKSSRIKIRKGPTRRSAESHALQTAQESEEVHKIGGADFKIVGVMLNRENVFERGGGIVVEVGTAVR